MNLTSPTQVKRLLAKYGIRPKKRLGQHFLIDRNVLNRILEVSGVGPDVSVLEVGPGLGVVTREICNSGARVTCVEIDTSLVRVLRDVLADAGGVEIVTADFLRIDLSRFLAERGGGKWIVVGNLPYYITTPIVTLLLDAKQCFSKMVLMVQKEVAERFRAKPATSDYGSLTVFLEYHCEMESVMRVSRNAFYPAPEVDSELVKLKVREKPPVDVADERLFFRIVRAAFGKRRKTLLNALSSSGELGWGKSEALAALSQAGIDPARRGETLSIEEFACLANAGKDSFECSVSVPF
ncbi:MAG: 16S rRNA (adenine(1518)-N(6)/adenine(1519)-N(6))-dimethyltransferase RsmA [Armatimonadetes bacterium]|nr:16S rRNA (adenine(1518)-N(6)/adenine(1519)-N(6))-dimethyltransferase RsmA [Armatimonadota bacterium]